MPAYAGGLRWYCVQTDIGADERVREKLQQRGFETLLQLMVQRLPGQQPRIVRAFPGYVFVRFDVSGLTWRSIHALRGVHRLFSSAPERPMPIPERQMERLFALRRSTGLIDEGAPPEGPAIAVDAQVVVQSGPFTGLAGICTWSKDHRIRVLLGMFGGVTSVELGSAQVQVR